jgi:hypothetical protein
MHGVVDGHDVWSVGRSECHSADTAGAEQVAALLLGELAWFSHAASVRHAPTLLGEAVDSPGRDEGPAG